MKISATIIKNSINSSGHRLTTFEIFLPKVLLAEFNTHRMLSKNFQSSRAIPTSKMNEIESMEPRQWLSNRPGMSASDKEIETPNKAKELWNKHIEDSKRVSTELTAMGLHKQWANRPNDWHIMAKGVISGTEWGNLLWLRDHEDAQPEFAELARCIKLALQESEPITLYPGEWHVPYIETRRLNGTVHYYDSNNEELTLQDAVKISTSCCAQVSYRRLDESRTKALDIYDKLIGAERKHFSPFEHQATPIPSGNSTADVMNTVGVSHVDKAGDFWSGNLRGWIQHRKILEDGHEV